MTGSASTHAPASGEAALDLPLAEWLVLALIAERPCHGFAVVTLTAAQAELGQIWHVSHPMVYRAITRLTERDLIAPIGSEDSERGPQRTVYAASRNAKAQVAAWLNAPVTHPRDVRAELLVKLSLLYRRGKSLAVLAERQRAVMEPIVESLEAKALGVDGFQHAVFSWRAAQARATLDFLDAVEALGDGPVHTVG